MANSFIDNFLKNLQPEESKVIYRYLKNNISNAEESKTLQIYEQIISGKPVEFINKSSLNKIKSRLFEKSLDALINNELLIKNNLSEFDVNYFKLKKQLIQCKYLLRTMTNQKVDALKHLLNHIIIASKKFEMYPLLTEALISLKYFNGNRANRNDFELINGEIFFYENCSNLLNKANDNYFRLIIERGISRTLKDNEFEFWLRNIIEETTENFRKTKSQQINYYLHIFRAAYHEFNKQYNEAIIQFRNLIILMKKYPATYKKERLGFAYDNLCQFSIYSYDYKNAEKYVKSSKQFLNKNSLENIIRIEVEFLVNFYSQKYSNAEKNINSILKFSKPNLGELRKAKYTYFKCYSLLQKKEFKAALNLLKTPLEIEKDKCDWKIGTSILTIILFIELNKISEATRALEALRKYIERNKKDEKIKERDRLIVECLRAMEKDNYEYNSGNKNVSKIIKQLSLKNRNTSWEHFTPELIPFHEWVKEKF